MRRAGKLSLFIFFIALFFFTIGCNPAQSGDDDQLSSSPDSTFVDDQEEIKKELTGEDIRLEKNIRYDKYLLDDEYPYKDTTRHFQWEKIQEQIAVIENAMAEGGNWGVLKNYRNMNKEAPTVADFVRNEYGRVSDQFGVERYQSAPLYSVDGDTTLVRYGRDGWIVKLPDNDTSEMVRVKGVSFEGEFLVPNRYILSWRDSVRFNKVIAVDVTNQNIATLEKNGDTWQILSMSHATTGVHKPPYAQETPTGIFAVQEKKEKMLYLRDGTSEIAGFAPYASRFTNGAYVHGVPTQYPNKSIIESSPTLGTTPRSHMCVRNASSHSKFVFDWATVKESVVVVID
ncbi:L,D-transpeptidase [Proteiniphilum sp. X52]|uniref:L,D-transpeptidase n=1 Tax=Proteiniphilum sp. X52 TaxID=2382159 RepID=UPI000F0A65B3|nr:L,D-transpeptidase [Proteiniphilum sp. X52]RNC65053.1 murein L,D-transpeptidase [Proteiniphilum sp. X52]